MSKSWPTGTIKLAAANKIFSGTPISFEAIKIGSEVAGYRAVGPVEPVEHKHLTACVKMVVTKIWEKGQ